MASYSAAGLPKLPPPPAREMAGPTPWCNWCIPGRVIAGAYPASLDDVETERILTTLLELGVNTFVCLQAEVNINCPEHVWRSGQGLRPYIKDAQRILSKAHDTGNRRIQQQKIDFLHLPIIDGDVTTDSAVSRLAEDCMERVLRGEKLYVHCWGGHGRTGTLISVMLGRLYGLSYTTAMRYCQIYHDARTYPQGVRSPHTPVQRAQVRRLLADQSAMSMAASVQPKAAAAAHRPGQSVLSPNGAELDVAGRRPGSRASPSPQRMRAAGATPGRYSGAGRANIGDSPLKSADRAKASQDQIKAGAGATGWGGSGIDRLAGSFAKMSPPSGVVAGSMAEQMSKNPVNAPVYSGAARVPQANSLLRQYANVR